jgi:hypothetical protein
MDREIAAHTAAGAALFRAAAEDALVAAGLHVGEGVRLWEAFRCARRAQWAVGTPGPRLGGAPWRGVPGCVQLVGAGVTPAAQD